MDEEEEIEALTYAFDVMAEAYLDWTARGRSARAFWRWVHGLVLSRANTISKEDAANEN